MKFTRILLFIALFPVLALAQDPGAVDSVELVVAVSPNSQTGQANLQLDLFVYNDEPLIEASMGFFWDNPNLQMDSAFGSPLTVNGFTDGLHLFEAENLDSTNADQHFLFRGIEFNIFPADLSKKRLWASYYFTFAEWTSTDTIRIDTLTFNAFSAYQFVDMQEVLIAPDWAGGLEITDSVAANQPPVLDSIGPQTFTENQSGSFYVFGSDPDGDSVSYSSSLLPTGTEFFLSGDSMIFDWVPDLGQAGDYFVTFYIADTAGAIDSEVVTITVLDIPCSDLSIASFTLDGPQEISFDREFQFRLNLTLENLGLLSVDSQFTLNFYYSEFPDIFGQGSTQLLGSQTVSSIGLGQFDIDITESVYMGLEASPGPAYVLVNIEQSSFIDCNPLNNLDSIPFELVLNIGGVLDSIGDKEVNEGETLGIQLNAFDWDDDQLAFNYFWRFGSDTLKNVTFFDSGNGAAYFEVTPDFTEAGVYDISFEVQDFQGFKTGGSFDVEDLTITVNNVNRPPVFQEPIDDQFVDEGEELYFGTSAFDPDFDRIFYYAESPTIPDSEYTFEDIGKNFAEFLWTPGFDDAGVHTFYLYADDNLGGVAVDTVLITVNNVNRAPVLEPISDTTVDENEFLSFQVTATDDDNDNIIMSIVDTDLPAGYTFEEIFFRSTTVYGFNWTPTFDNSGTYTATIVASDGVAADSQVITITVDHVDRPAVLEPIGDKFVSEGGTLEFTIFGSDPDVEDTISFIDEGSPPFSDFNDNNDGTATFFWAPTSNDSGTFNVTFYLYGHDSEVPDDTEIITITVGNVNQPPVLDPIGAQTFTENQFGSFFASGFDPDSTIPTLTTSTLPTGATFIDNANGTGTFNWTPTFLQSGVYNVTFYATDDSSVVDSEIVVITVNQVNQPPVLAAIGSKIVDESVNLNFGVSASDIDGTIAILTTSALPAGATFINNTNGTGTFNWTPGFTQAGIYNITFTASDGVLVDNEIVQITVNNVNRPPVFQEPIDDQFVDEGEELYFGTSAFDPDFDRISYYAESPTIPDGEYTFEDIGKNFAEFLWTPGFNDAGVHTFYLYADDNLGGIAVDTVLITVNNINLPPAFDEISSQEVNENDLLDFQISATDIDGTILALSVQLPLPLGASFTDNGNGTATFNWQPDCNQSIIDGSYFITCYAADDSGAVDTGFFEIYVYEFCDVELSVDQASCVQCVPPQTYADILVYEEGFVIEFNNHVDPSTLDGNILFNSHRGISFEYFYNEKLKQIEVYPRFSSFATADTIMVSLNTNILDLSESPLDSTYNLVYRTGGQVYPGDCNNDGTVNEIDVLSIGLYYTNTGPNRDYEYYESGPFDFFAQAVHFEQGLEIWSPVNGVYADVDGSGVVDANDICGVAYNFGETVSIDNNSPANPTEKKSTLKEYGTSVLQAMYDALIECQSDKAPELMEMIEAALRESSPLLPTEVELYQNYPNPFNPSTTIELYLPKAGQVTLEVYNMLGQRVITLLNEEVEAGYKEVTWPSIDNSGSQVASGIYFYKLVTESKVITKRMLLVK